MGQIEFPPEPNWQPLRLIIADEKKRREYMFMGTFVAANGSPKIELYKHESSRRYLNVDAAGDCYFYDGAGAARGENPYRKISRREAIEHLRVNSEK